MIMDSLRTYFQASGNARQASKPAVRFGWYYRQHQAVDSAVQKRIPTSSSLSSFLDDPPIIDTIQWRSAKLDGPNEPNKRSHFTNIDTNGRRLSTPFRELTLKDARRALERSTARENIDWHSIEESITPSSGRRQNIIINTLWAYGQLSQTFRNVGSPQSNISYEEIAMRIADLLHYAADICQPLHETTYADWKLLRPYTVTRNGIIVFTAEGMHSFIESSAIKFRFRLPGKETDTIPPSRATVQRRLINELTIANKHVDDIVQADYETRNKDGEKQARYVKSLASHLSPVVNGQLKRATALASDLLWWSYLAGGQPDLSSLLPEGIRQKSRQR